MKKHFVLRFAKVVAMFALSALLAVVATAQNRQVRKEDMPRIPHTPVERAVSTFSLADGFSLELVAAEPLVADPVDACFDADGRMYVAEMHGYPFSQEPTKLNPQGGGKEDAGLIRLLEDTDADGRFDQSIVFADKISWPTSVCCYDGGVFVLAPKFLYYFKDTDGDNKADVREIILEGFGRDNVQSLTNNLKWGLDNKIYFAGGRNGGEISHRGQPAFTVNGRDVRFDPRSEEFELISGGVQFGHSMDDWGRRFVCSNSNHAQQVMFPQHYLARHPGLAAPALVRSIAEDGASGRVFRASPPEPWRIVRQKWRAEEKGYRLLIEDGQWKFIPLDPSKKAGVVPTEYPVGYFTSATGLTIYRGGAYPERYRGNAFVGDVGGNLVHRKIMRQAGIASAASRADEGEELIRSTDNWFRPVNFVNAPDGTLYVLDMYRETVEHPFSIPEEIKKFLFLESGDDRGRVFRLVSPDLKRISAPKLANANRSTLVAQLASPNAWNRETAQRLLWERQDKRVVPELKRVALESTSVLSRLHALYTLQGLDALNPSTLLPLVDSENARLREHVVRLSEPYLTDDAALFEAVSALVTDADDRVRFQLAFSLGESPNADATGVLCMLAKSDGANGDIRIAILSSSAGRANEMLSQLAGDTEFLALPHAKLFLSELVVASGSHPSSSVALGVLERITAPDVAPEIKQSVLTGLGEGLTRRGRTLSSLLADAAATDEIRRQVKAMFTEASEVAGDETRSLMTRATAVGLLAFADFKSSEATLGLLLRPQSPPVLQSAAVAALSQQPANLGGRLLLENWRSQSPEVRRSVIDAVLGSVVRTQILLERIEAKRILPTDIPRDKLQVLLNHPNATIRSTSAKLLAEAVTATDRAKVVSAYQDVLGLEGDLARGAAVFAKKCGLCHKVGGIGHQVAPDLASVQNKSLADLLVAVLDPNREAQPNYNTYTVTTLDGRIFNGIIATEGTNSITVRKAEAKEDVVLRSNIDELISSGKSLMPEGLEKDLSRQDLADVLSFVKSIKPAKK
jgi:putative membrane-bound dehydrogenase-like protein